MKLKGQLLSQNRQRTLHQVETATRSLVGYGEYFKAGHDTGVHAHPRAQLLYPVSGVMHIEALPLTFVVPPSTALFLPANLMHRISMEGAVELRTLFLLENAIARIGNKPKVITLTPLLRELIIAANAEPLDWDLSGRGRFIAELAFDEIAASTELNFKLQLPSDKRAERVAQNILAAPSDNRNIEEWANVANVSSRTLTRLFRRETGLSFIQWRQQVRLTKAMEALVKGIAPKEAAAVGCYESVSAFGISFRKIFGITPGAAKGLFEQGHRQALSVKGD
jgi:AraC-like DNA-binding protein